MAKIVILILLAYSIVNFVCIFLLRKACDEKSAQLKAISDNTVGALVISDKDNMYVQLYYKDGLTKLKSGQIVTFDVSEQYTTTETTTLN